jgi:hypothetical protein
VLRLQRQGISKGTAIEFKVNGVREVSAVLITPKGKSARQLDKEQPTRAKNALNPLRLTTYKN